LFERLGLVGLPLGELTGPLLQLLAGFARHLTKLLGGLLTSLGGFAGGLGRFVQAALRRLTRALATLPGELRRLRRRLRFGASLASRIEGELGGFAGELLLGGRWSRLRRRFVAFACLGCIFRGSAILRFSGLGRVGLLLAGRLGSRRRLCLRLLFLSRASRSGLPGELTLLLSELARLPGRVFRTAGLLLAVGVRLLGLGSGLCVLAGELFELLLFLFGTARQLVTRLVRL
jgi:hypothetical protein